MPAVEIVNISVEKSPHPKGKRFLSRSQKQVKVIGHERPGLNKSLTLKREDRSCSIKDFAILFLFKYLPESLL
jgi:hypothetical protein